ncbi:MAG: HAMP domain-containing histidine kinase [Treponema sp.]|nr:HAMP domain-containing histidine kinase [Treponema sp.]
MRLSIRAKVILIILAIIVGMTATGVVIGVTLTSVVITGTVFLGLGLIIALSSAACIARPFEQVEELSLAAKAASEERERFLTGMGYEMRNALNAIIGFAELELGKERDDDIKSETWASLEKIYSFGLCLLDFINDVLDVSSMESGKFELVPATYDMPSLINDTVVLNVAHIGSKPVVFKLDLDENLPVRLCGDERRVKQILDNLLSNAFAYTWEGTVKLKIRCERDEEGVWMTYTISDTGVGVRDEDIDRLFGDYSRADTRNNLHIDGNGLGLIITKRLVEMMRGSIYVKSEYDKGSTVKVRLFQGFVDNDVIGRGLANNLENGFRNSLAGPMGIMDLEESPIRIVESGGGVVELALDRDEWESLREVEAGLKMAELIRAAALEDLDWEKGLERCGGDGKAYVESLRFYTAHTPALLDSIRTVGPLDEYSVTVQGIKGSSYGISADSLGLKAERLEYAARNGNRAFVEAENDRFVGAVEKFIIRLADLLDTLDLMRYRPHKDARIDRSELEAVKLRLMSRDCDDTSRQFGWPIGA